MSWPVVIKSLLTIKINKNKKQQVKKMIDYSTTRGHKRYTKGTTRTTDISPTFISLTNNGTNNGAMRFYVLSSDRNRIRNCSNFEDFDQVNQIREEVLLCVG